MKKTVVLGMSVLLLCSCNNSGQANSSGEAGTTAEVHKEQQHNEGTDAMELNNGEKWMVNKEMKPYVLKGEELVNNYIQESQSDNIALAKQLKDQNNQLITSCTMKGKSHDELHKWLYPHLGLVEKLLRANKEEANELVLQIEKSYQTYHKYFQ